MTRLVAPRTQAREPDADRLVELYRRSGRGRDHTRRAVAGADTVSA